MPERCCALTGPIAGFVPLAALRDVRRQPQNRTILAGNAPIGKLM
jgi:hypothetical protein